jgi:hypothetical protein
MSARWVITKKHTAVHGKKTCIYHKPRTPNQRVIDSRALTLAKATLIVVLFEAINPAELTHRITAIQTRLNHPCERQNQSDYCQRFASILT